MPAPIADHLALLDQRVAALGRARPDLEDALALQSELIRTALETARAPMVSGFPLPRAQAAERVREGVPLLHDQPVTIDIHFAADLFSRLVNVLTERSESEPTANLEALVAAATSGRLDPQQVFGEAFVQHADHLAELAMSAGVDADLLTAIAVQSVAPVLRAHAERLLPLLEQLDDGTSERAVWSMGYCPVCGGWPLLGELRGVELAQWLRCSACGTGWRGARLACPYCRNDDYRSLGSLTIEHEARFRVSVCERCKGYLKVGNAFDPLPGDLLALDDVASMHLDLAALERGYERPAASGYRIELAVPEEEWMEELA